MIPLHLCLSLVPLFAVLEAAPTSLSELASKVPFHSFEVVDNRFFVTFMAPRDDDDKNEHREAREQREERSERSPDEGSRDDHREDRINLTEDHDGRDGKRQESGPRHRHEPGDRHRSHDHHGEGHHFDVDHGHGHPKSAGKSERREGQWPDSQRGRVEEPSGRGGDGENPGDPQRKTAEEHSESAPSHKRFGSGPMSGSFGGGPLGMFRPGMGPHHSDGRAGSGVMAGIIFELLDSDHNGSLSREEFQKLATAVAKSHHPSVPPAVPESPGLFERLPMMGPGSFPGARQPEKAPGTGFPEYDRKHRDDHPRSRIHGPQQRLPGSEKDRLRPAARRGDL